MQIRRHSLQWRHNGHDGVSNHQPHDCLLSTFYSDADQRKHQSSVSLAFVWEIHRGPVNSPHKWQVTRKLFPLEDVIIFICIPALRRSVCSPRQHLAHLCYTFRWCCGTFQVATLSLLLVFLICVVLEYGTQLNFPQNVHKLSLFCHNQWDYSLK